MERISFLYSTCEDRIYQLLDRVFAAHSKDFKGEVVIVHQTLTPEKFKEIPDLLSGINGVVYVLQSQLGVTKSRNLAISLATSEYILFCDDDVDYVSIDVSKILEALKGAKACTFRVASTEGGYTKNFSAYRKVHNKFSILSVGTIEVVCDRRFVVNNHIQFPEDLGAGAKYPSCDEPVFLSRIMKAGGRVDYVPLTICAPPPESSGKSLASFEAVYSRAIAFRYIFGSFFYMPVLFVFLIKNLRRIGVGNFLSVILKVLF